MVSPKLWIIERFANCADMIGRSTSKALVAIFNRQCEVREGKVVVKAKTGGDCIQNPSDADATYHWGCQTWFLFFLFSPSFLRALLGGCLDDVASNLMAPSIT